MSTLDELNERVARAQIDYDVVLDEIKQVTLGLEERRKAAGSALELALKEFYDAADATRIFARTRLEHERVRE